MAHDTLHSFQVDWDQATPMVRQFLEVKRDYPGVLLFYRMGDFYETFFEDALIAARVLEITLTGREAGKLGRIPMAGIPAKAVDSYLARLLGRNFRVAVCEQVEDPALAKGLVARKVVRVLSPGTVTDQSLLKPEENNFLAAIVLPKASGDPCGLAYCDITTGDFFATRLDYPRLLSELDRLRPSEILVRGRRKAAIPGEGVDEFVADGPPEITGAFRCTPLPEAALHTEDTTALLKNLLSVSTLEGFGLDGLPETLKACGMIAYYCKETFLDALPSVDRIRLYRLEETVGMTLTARRNLEILATAKQGQVEGSLLWALNRTATSMGARLLRQWLSQPLTHLPEIHSRLEAVEALVGAPKIRDALSGLLPEIYDLERLAIKIANLNAGPRDLVALKEAVRRLPALATHLKPLKGFYLERLHDFPPELFKAVALIDRAVDDSPAQGIREGGVIKAGYHQELDGIRETLEGHQAWLARYEEQERERTGIKALKIAFNQAFGYYIEVSQANLKHVPADYRRKQTLTNAERYTTEALKIQESKFLDAQGRRNDLEYRLFLELRERLLPYAPLLKDCAQRVAALDVLLSFATVAVEQHYVKPVVDASLELNIQEGRHPVVERMLPMGRFVPNPCVLSAEERTFQDPQVMIITGPNMAGKSTYMRQVALMILMAQVGSFVPASYARIGLVDQLFTRVGAVDDLAGGQSTFMVEMSETAQILNGATRRSFVLLDEVGRGTSTYDGVAIAQSVSEYLVNSIGCRTLFATHYHELNTLEEAYPKIRNYRVCVSERESGSDGEIEFLHRVEPGAAQKSYGVQVARMAGVPRPVVHRAGNLLNQMQRKELAHVTAFPKRNGGVPLVTEEGFSPQLTLFPPDPTVEESELPVLSE